MLEKARLDTLVTFVSTRSSLLAQHVERVETSQVEFGPKQL